MMSFVRGSFILFSFIVTLSLMSCRSGVYFNPDFHVGDHVSKSIVSENGELIPTDDPRFDDFACMSRSKIKELKQLLIRMKIPSNPQAKARLDKEYRKLVHRFNQQ